MGLFNAVCFSWFQVQIPAVNGQSRLMYATAEISMFTNFVPLLFAVLDTVVMDNLAPAGRNTSFHISCLCSCFSQLEFGKSNQLIQGLEPRKLANKIDKFSFYYILDALSDFQIFSVFRTS